MAVANDNGGTSGSGTGGGSTTSVCTINPSDNVSIINNLISRIADIERFLSYLVGADVYANNLSELAKDIGNILNGTITLPGGDDPNTDTIPPDEFTGTVISGNVITTWNNGVVSFQLINGVQTVGGGVTQYLVLQPLNTTITGGLPNLNSILYQGGSGVFDTGTLNVGEIVLNRSGFYHIDVCMPSAVRTTSGSSFMFITLFDNNTDYNEIFEIQEEFGQNSSPANNGNQNLQMSFSFPASENNVVVVSFQNVTALLSQATTKGIVSIAKLG